MRIAIIGYGKMGREVESCAIERGHEIGMRLGSGDEWPEGYRDVDVAIEFTRPEAAVGNLVKSFNRGVPVVTGTTGWLEDLDSVSEECKKFNSGLFYASNFSIGVNLFFDICSRAADLFDQFDDYGVAIREIHHTQKLDAPSGTAISIADYISDNMSRLEGWKQGSGNDNQIPIESIRLGDTIGTHEVMFASGIDSITLKHEAHNRKGFALGAVIAAEWMIGKTGVFTMTDLLNL